MAGALRARRRLPQTYGEVRSFECMCKTFCGGDREITELSIMDIVKGLVEGLASCEARTQETRRIRSFMVLFNLRDFGKKPEKIRCIYFYGR